MLGPKIRGVCKTRPTETGYQEVKYDCDGKLLTTPRVRYTIDGYQPPSEELPYCDEVGLDDA